MEKTFDILADQFRPMVVRYLRTISGDDHTAEDLAQETFMAAFKSIEKFEVGGSFGAWLRGIARNKFLQHKRSSSRQKMIVDERVVRGIEDVFGIFDNVAESDHGWDDQLSILETCVSRLTEKLRQAIELTYRGGKSLQEAANSLDSTPAAVGQRLSRARKLIRECVERQMSEEN